MNRAQAPPASDWPVRVAVLLVLLATFTVYAPVLRHGFVEWDDPYYVVENSHVQAGLTARGVAWAFTSREHSNWHPLTWVSHMLDVSLFGPEPWGHHLTNLLLHLANTWLLFLAFRRMTGAPWRSLMVAALFALHPMHVESVAWVAERKDVLSTMFWMLALWLYARHAERPGPGRYALVALAFGLGLMAKPMLVSLPLTLLILDGWPLQRVGDGGLRGWWPRLVEKLPLVAMSLAVSITAWVTQRSGGAITDTPIAIRLANSVLNYAGYLEKTFWPQGLSAFYPYRLHPPAAEVAMSAAVLVTLTAAVWWGRHRAYLPAGWLWYLVTLLPVIGIVRIGQQQMADRYSYVPLIGVFVMIAWGAGELAERARGFTGARRVAGVLAVLLVGALALAASRQVRTWESGVTLWERVLATGGSSTVSHNNLGVALQKAGRFDEAASQLREAIRLEPRHARAHSNLGNVQFAQGRYAEAIRTYDEALRLDPGHQETRRNMAKSHYNIGNAMWREGRVDSAVARYREAVRWTPEDAGLQRALGLALVQRERHEEAIGVLQESLRLDPDNAATHDALALALFHHGDFAGAWREVQACRARGGTPTASLVEALGQKMAEPR